MLVLPVHDELVCCVVQYAPRRVGGWHAHEYRTELRTDDCAKLQDCEWHSCCAQRMEEMAIEFGDMLKETLDKMGAQIDLQVEASALSVPHCMDAANSSLA